MDDGHTHAASEEDVLRTIERELRLIRQSIRRSRIQTGMLLAAVIGMAVIGVVGYIDDSSDDDRERENLAFVLRSRCEQRNEERVEDAEVLITVLAGDDPTPEIQQKITEYRQLLEDTSGDCDVEANDLLP